MGMTREDADNLNNALDLLRGHDFSAEEKTVLQTMVNNWDAREDHLTDHELATLHSTFENQFAVGGALAQIVNIAEKYAKQPEADFAIGNLLQATFNDLRVRNPRPGM